MLFRLPAPWTLPPAALEDALARAPLLPCTGLNLRSRGWVSPTGDGQLVYSQEGHLLIALGVEEKLLPASVVREAVKERAAALEQQKGFPPGRKHKRDLKDQVMGELTPRAFARRRSTRAWIDTRSGWIAVDSAAPIRAEELLTALRDALGDLKLEPLRSDPSIATQMTAWLAAGSPPGRFTLDDECELTSGDANRSTIRYLRHALEGREIPAHISSGKVVTRLALSWSGKVSFVLNDRLLLKRIAFLDLDETRAQDGQDAERQFEADFGLMTGELSQLRDDFAAVLAA